MDKQAATQLIGDTFNYPFDEGRFRNFALNLLNNVDETKGFDYLSGTYIRHSFKDHITKYRRLGTYTDPTGETIDVLVVELKNEWALERSRTMLRNFTSDYLKNRDEKDAALVAYYTTNPDDWRFSYIRMEYKRVQNESGKFKIKEDITPAKRYSFLVGKNEPNHTAQAQLVGMLSDDRNNPTLTELETAFSVDAVTKQFYKDYRDQFEKLWNELNDIVDKDPKIAEEFETQTINTANFAKKLMGQIVFLYFLQKKGWLGVEKDSDGNFKDWGTGPKNFMGQLFSKEKGESGKIKFTDYGNFFNEVLEPLFYEALATERTSDVFTQFNCKIPFLNGGLFEPINDYNWKETDIRIDNDIISDVFDTFDRYNFTVREDEPLEKEVAVDPEMLGKVFENLLPENLRKGKGAYYTPRTIVHYMCQESLINYLDTECESVPKEDIETLIKEGDIILELETAIVEQDKKYKSALMDSIKDNAQALDDALANIKVCDPAIGSGAFPVGMLTEIIKARKVLELYLDKKLGVYELKRHCIQNSLYGVDIDPGAIEIAKLRLWLSLVVDEDDYTTIQPLPNLDYKIMQGNSLIEEFHGISLDIKKNNKTIDWTKGSQADAFFGGEKLDALIKDLHQKQKDFFNAEHPREKKEKRDAVETAIYEIFHSEITKVTGLVQSEKKVIEAELKEMTHGNRERNFFPWKLYFADVFRENRGFDVVIANPPYIKEYTDKHAFDGLRNSSYYQGKMDIWYLFACDNIDILKENAILTFIATNNWVTNFGASKMRNKIIKDTKILKLINFKNYKIFESAGIQTMIMMFQKNNQVDNYSFDYRELNENATEFSNVVNLLNKKQMDDNIIFTPSIIKNDYIDKLLIFNNPIIENVLQIIEKFDNFKLTENEVAQGIVFPQDFLNKKNNKKLDDIYNIGDGIFVLSDFELQSLKLTEKEKTLIKPYFTTNEMFQYFGDLTNKHWTIYTSSEYKNPEKMNPYPNIKKHLDKFEKVITSDNKPYGLHRTRNENFFKGEKIISLRKCSDRPYFTYTNFDCYVSATFYVIKTIRINQKLLTGFLNSSLCAFWLRNKGKMQGNNYQIDKEPLVNIPIPIISELFQGSIIDHVDKILTSKKANPQADTAALEAEIDQMVYELYGLTEEEIQIVEESVG